MKKYIPRYDVYSLALTKLFICIMKLLINIKILLIYNIVLSIYVRHDIACVCGGGVNFLKRCAHGGNWPGLFS